MRWRGCANRCVSGAGSPLVVVPGDVGVDVQISARRVARRGWTHRRNWTTSSASACTRGTWSRCRASRSMPRRARADAGGGRVVHRRQAAVITGRPAAQPRSWAACSYADAAKRELTGVEDHLLAAMAPWPQVPGDGPRRVERLAPIASPSPASPARMAARRPSRSAPWIAWRARTVSSPVALPHRDPQRNRALAVNAALDALRRSWPARLLARAAELGGRA
jgi:hypothetical protein